MVPGMLVAQCAAVITRSPCGLSITLAVQKCCFSFPPDVANKAPTAGVPANACPFREFEAKCLMARTKPVAMSPAAPLAGATVAITPTTSAVTRAAPAGAGGVAPPRAVGGRDRGDHPDHERRDQGRPGRFARGQEPVRPSCLEQHLPGSPASFCPDYEHSRTSSILNCDAEGATVLGVNALKMIRSHPSALGIPCETAARPPRGRRWAGLYLGSGRSMFQCLLCEAPQPSSASGSASGSLEVRGSMVNRVTHRCPPS